jgi:hypothetical protein
MSELLRNVLILLEDCMIQDGTRIEQKINAELLIKENRGVLGG